MKIVIAIDSFKGSMTSAQAGNAAAKGFRKRIPEAEILVKPIADGGEGTVSALVEGMNGFYKEVQVQNPLGRIITTHYGIIDTTAVIEIAAAAGIALLNKKELDPINATTYGVGQMIKDAIASGCRDFIIGLGGSATNDGGVGMLQALGFEFLDVNGHQVPRGAKGLPLISKIELSNAIPQLETCRFHIACDIKNPLCGENGCSAVFSRQKGATESEIPLMDEWMAHYAKCTALALPHADENLPGAGAAGGLGFAFKNYLRGNLTSGIELILDKTDFASCIKNADLVVTGEGKIDSQTIMGKTPIGVAKLAKKYHKPVIAFAGCLAKDAEICNHYGIDAIFSIINAPCSLEMAMDTNNAQENMTNCAYQVANLFMLSK